MQFFYIYNSSQRPVHHGVPQNWSTAWTSGLTSGFGARGRSNEVSPSPKVVTWVWRQQSDFRLNNSLPPRLCRDANPAMLRFSLKFLAIVHCWLIQQTSSNSLLLSLIIRYFGEAVLRDWGPLDCLLRPGRGKTASSAP